MIRRYTNPEMGAIWSEQRRYECWLEVELAAADAMAEAGIVPADAARELRQKAAFDIDRIEEIEQTTQHDVIAFTTAVAEKVGPAARWLHFGLTSSDVVDTAQALQMRQACDLTIKDVAAPWTRCAPGREEHRRTPMIGRTHGVHAEPMTLGVKLALWYAELQRNLDRLLRARDIISVGKISGAVGTFAHLDPAIEARVCETLGLQPAPVSSQVIQRDRHAELIAALAITAASLEKFALEIRGLQKTEIGEVEEPFGKGQKGSSAMPHKRNPIGCEQITGLARLLRANAMAAFENVALWHERDISHSSVERVILPDSFIALDHMLRRFTRIVRGMVVYPDRMKREPGAVPRRRVLGHGAARARAARRLARTGLRMGAAQRDALVPRADGLQVAAARRRGPRGGAAAGRDRKGVRPRRPAAQRGRDFRARVRPGGLNESQSVRDAEAVRVRSAGTHHRRRAAFDGLRRGRRRAAGEVLRARARRAVRRPGPRAGRPKWPTRCWPIR